MINTEISKVLKGKADLERSLIGVGRGVRGPRGLGQSLSVAETSVASGRGNGMSRMP